MANDDAKYCMGWYEFEEVVERLLDSINWKREFIGSKNFSSVINDIITQLWIQQIPESEDTRALRYQIRVLKRNGTFDLHPWKAPE